MSSLSSVLGITSRPSSVGFGWSYSTPSPRTPKPVDGPIKFEPDTYSRKVFVGGLPPDIDEGESCLCEIFHTLHSYNWHYIC